MWMTAIARKTPPANELAMPKTLGLSRQDFDHVGIKPVQNDSKKTIKMNENLTQKFLSITISPIFNSKDRVLFNIN